MAKNGSQFGAFFIKKPLLLKIAHKRDVTLSLTKSLYSVCNSHDSQDPLKGSKGVGRWKGIGFTDFSNQTQE